MKNPLKKLKKKQVKTNKAKRQEKEEGKAEKRILKVKKSDIFRFESCPARVSLPEFRFGSTGSFSLRSRGLNCYIYDPYKHIHLTGSFLSRSQASGHADDATKEEKED